MGACRIPELFWTVYIFLLVATILNSLPSFRVLLCPASAESLEKMNLK